MWVCVCERVSECARERERILMRVTKATVVVRIL